MGQRPHRDEVNPSLGDGADAVEAHVPGSFEGDTASDESHGFAHQLKGHVVEHDHVGAGGQGVSDLGEVGRFDFDADAGADGGAGPADGLGDAPDVAQMIVLDQDHVGEAQAMVRPAAGFNGVFLEEAQAGGRLARVEDLGFGPCYGVDETTRGRGDSREPLEEVESGPLALEQGDRRPLDARKDVGFAESRPVLDLLGDFDSRVDFLEDAAGDRQTGQDSVFFGQENGFGTGVSRDDAFRGDVPLGHIFAQRRVDDSVKF
jgi:hypothetical protein